MITNKTEGKARKGHRKQAYLKAAIYEIQHQVLDELFRAKQHNKRTNPKKNKTSVSYHPFY